MLEIPSRREGALRPGEGGERQESYLPYTRLEPIASLPFFLHLNPLISYVLDVCREVSTYMYLQVVMSYREVLQ